MFVEAIHFADLLEGVPLIVKVQGKDLALVLWRGKVYAARNICPHMSESFIHGKVRDLITAGGALGDLAVNSEEPEIVCPWHQWPYELRTGQCTVDPNLRVRTYVTEIRDSRVLVDMGAARE